MTTQEIIKEAEKRYFNELNEFYQANQKMIVSLWEHLGLTIEEWENDRELKLAFIVKVRKIAEQGNGLTIA